MNHEEEVRKHWECCGVETGAPGDWCRAAIDPHWSQWCPSEKAAWKTMWKYTQGRLKEIAELEEEIDVTKSEITACRTYGTNLPAIHRRILARLQSALATLKEGIRQDALSRMEEKQ